MCRIFAITFFASALTMFSFGVTPAHCSPTKLGAFIKKAGENNVASQAFEQGMQIAIEKKSPPVFAAEFIEEAKGSGLDGAELKSLVETEKVPLLVYWNVDSVATVAPYLNQSRVVGLVSWEVNEKISTLGNHIFGFGYSTELTFQNFAKFAGKTLHSNRIAIISAAGNPFETQASAFSEESKSLGNTVVFDEKVSSESADFKALISRALKENCDTIFAALPATALTSLVKAARAEHYAKHLLVGDTLFSLDIAALGKDADGLYLVQPWSDDSTFKALYSTKFGTNPDPVLLGTAALGYDAVNCIQEMQSPLGSGAIKSSLLSKPCVGLTGTTMFTGERIAQRKKRVITIKDGQFALIE